MNLIVNNKISIKLYYIILNMLYWLDKHVMKLTNYIKLNCIM